MAFSKLSGQESVLKVDSFEILGKIYLQKFVSHVLFLLLIVFCLKKSPSAYHSVTLFHAPR